MSSNLYQASSQWATRPADQRFWTVAELHDACKNFRARATERLVPWKDLRVQVRNATPGDLVLIGPQGVPAHFTHHAFGQLCQRAGAPAGYLRSLPGSLAAECLTLTMPTDDNANLLLSRSNGDDSVSVHALLTDKYQRIWDSEVTERLLILERDGWRVPPARPAYSDQPGARAATEADVLIDRQGGGGRSVNVGDMIAPAGLYASDHDVFAFMVREDRTIDAGEGRGLNRGFFVWNSEVGAASFGIMTFLYDHVCGNHIVWGARDVKKVRIRHVGGARDRMGSGFRAQLTEYMNASAAGDADTIRKARSYQLGKDKQAVLDAVFGKRLPGITQTVVTRAYELAEVNEARGEGNPRSLWGMVNGLTRVSQYEGYAENRVEIDKSAGKLMELVF